VQSTEKKKEKAMLRSTKPQRIREKLKKEGNMYQTLTPVVEAEILHHLYPPHPPHVSRTNVPDAAVLPFV
jgi:hypothetical protein